jgi:hexokinase
MADHLDNYTRLFTLSAQRMRMIVAAFEETLDKGLQEWDQVIVSSQFDGTFTE